MPNWCYNQVMLYGEPKQLEKVWLYIKKAYENEAATSRKWLNRLIIAAGLNHEDYSCRGWIVNLDDEGDYTPGIDDSFKLDFESAWNPAMSAIDIAIRVALKDYAEPDVSYELMAEEPSEGIFINTDTEGVYFKERYYLDFEYKDGVPEVEEVGIHYFWDLKTMLDFFEKLTGYRPKDFEAAEKFEYDENIFDYISIHEFSSEWGEGPYSDDVFAKAGKTIAKNFTLRL